MIVDVKTAEDDSSHDEFILTMQSTTDRDKWARCYPLQLAKTHCPIYWWDPGDERMRQPPRLHVKVTPWNWDVVLPMVPDDILKAEFERRKGAGEPPKADPRETIKALNGQKLEDLQDLAARNGIDYANKTKSVLVAALADKGVTP